MKKQFYESTSFISCFNTVKLVTITFSLLLFLLLNCQNQNYTDPICIPAPDETTPIKK